MSGMKRLSVRLSVVGAVLAIGAAVIAHSVLTRRAAPAPLAEAPDGAGEGQLAAEPPAPIRADDTFESSPASALQPPPASAFTRSNGLRTVSHDDADPPVEATRGQGGSSAFPLAVDPVVPESDRYRSFEQLADDEVGQDAADRGAESSTTSLIPADPWARGSSYGALSPPLEDPTTSSPADHPASPAPDAYSPVYSDRQSDAGSFPLAAATGERDATYEGADLEPVPSETVGGASELRSSPAPDAGPPAPVLRSDFPSSRDVPPPPFAGGGAASSRPQIGAVEPADPWGDAVRGQSSPTGGAREVAASATLGATPLASNTPGDPQWEGQQNPAIVLEKTAPEEVQVDREATFHIRVRNVGNAPAHGVTVADPIPRGVEFIEAIPPCTRTPEGVLVWDLSTIRPGEEVTLSVRVMPQVAGEIGSVAQATFHARASVRTLCTQPRLALSLQAPESVLLGQPATLEINVTNTGNGAASNVVIEVDVPEGFTHAAGRELEHELGTIPPQESRRLNLVLDSTQPGLFQNRLAVRGDGNLSDEDIRQIAVTAPQLEISLQGPRLRYLDRQATYAVRLANPGTASARNVELVAFLPKGMKYVTSDSHGQYDSQSHAVYWSLEELPADKQGEVHVTVLPIEPGTQKLKADGRADLGLRTTSEHEVVVEGIAELSFAVTDSADPIEVGSETGYEIRVVNRGSKPDSDVLLVVECPPGITPLRGEGPVEATVEGQRVVFGTLARLAPGEEAVYRVSARGTQTGDHVTRVQLRSTEIRVPVAKEEITRVYLDQ
jgi:uncharacterized repeat protein (TIGR01451 family)